MHIILLLNRSAAHVRGIVQFVRQFLRHAFFGTRAGILQNPPDRQAGSPVLRNFHRHLIVGAAYATRLHFQQRLCVFNRLLKQLERIVLRPVLDLVHRSVENPLRCVLLAVPHHRIDEFLSQRRVVYRIWQNLPRFWSASAWHMLFRSPLWRHYLAGPLGRLAPYFDRLCLRSVTPAASSVPRTT